ncbi:hypothetical protein Q4601_19775 [Shewanella sp. 1_MG-2023]|uniref:hypothetical protein n=1 Tax=unclassified Shewanella TaxID=196818 RepID=UPI0026E121A1|nr:MULTISPECIES: hypothetical protein [unclassified Shewanella]MDO6613730.1 hypothetical protein [Shewanella sp. 7_MG-2023]MDO6772662.1 hypothetical protein [Shewanella sp. 2_MG-2023]MDO6796534.1 hypothetical protein [Shewanella sp. 1_MG-2023]
MNLFRNIQALNKQSSASVFNNLKDIVGDDSPAVSLIAYSLSDWEGLSENLSSKGLTIDNANDLISLLSQKYPDYQEPTSKLMNPISELKEPLEWPLIDISASQSIPIHSASFTYNGQVSSNLCIEAIDKPPHEEWPSILGSESLMSYSIEGKFSAGTALNLSMTSGALALNVSGSVQSTGAGNLNIYFKHDATKSVIESAINDFAHIDALTDIAVIQGSNFAGLIVDIKGGLKLQSDMTLGSVFETQYSLNKTITNKPVALKIGVGASVGWQLDGEMQLSCYVATNSTDLIIQVARKRSTTTTNSLSIGAKIVAPGVKEQASKYVKELKSYHDEIMEVINTYAEPKQWLLNNINERLENQPDWQQTVLGVGLGQVNNQELQEEVSELIADELSKPFSSFSSWSEDLNKQNVISENLASRIGRNKANETEAYLFKLLNETANDYYQALSSKVKGWLTNSIDRNLLKPLSEFGLQVDETLDNTEESIEKVMAPLLELLNHYNKNVLVMTDFIENTMIEELGVDFKRSEKKLNTNQSLLKVRFNMDSHDKETLNTLIGECLTGDFRNVLLGNDANDLYQLEESVFTQMQDNTKTISLTINFFGIKTSKRTMFNSKAIIQYDGSGQLSVYETQSILKALNEAGNEKNYVKLFNHVNLLNGSKSKFSITIGYNDGDLTSSELNGFLQIFERTRLIEKGTTQKISNELSAKRLIDSSEEHNLRLTNVLSLSRHQVESACNVPEDKIFKIALKQQLLAWKQYALLHPHSAYAEQLWLLECFNKTQPLYQNVIELADMSRFQRSKKLERVLNGLYDRAPSREIKKRVNSAIKMVNKTCDNASSMIGYLKSLKTLINQDVPSEINETLSESTINLLTNSSEHLNELIQDWVKTFSTIYQLDIDRAHPCSVALLGVFRELSETEPETIIPLIYQNSDGLVKPIVIL